MNIALALLLGWLAGWLVNYISDVLPTIRRLGRPICPKCDRPFRATDYLLFRGCPSCGQARGPRTLAVQVVMMVSAVILAIIPNLLPPFWMAFILLIYLAIVFVIDLEHRLILHPVSLVGVLLGIGIGIYMHSIAATFIGGAAGFLMMLVFYYVGKWYVNWMAKRKKLPKDEVALGFGDVSFSGILGLLLGWPSIMAGLLWAVLAGGLVSLAIVLRMLVTKKYKAFTAIPYAPFLVLSALLIFFYQK